MQTTPPRKLSTQALGKLCQLGYLGLVFMLSAWFMSQGTAQGYSDLFSLLWIVPLLLPLKGILQGNPYTYAWAGFILCLYLLHSFTLLWVNPNATFFALIESVLLLSLLTGFSLYARWRGQELGLKLKKLKQLEQEESEQFEKRSNK